MPTLMVHFEGRQPRRFDFDASCVVGRELHCDLVLQDRSVSREHAKFEVGPEGKVIVTDLESENGVFASDKRVDRHEVEPGEPLLFGSVSVKLLGPSQDHYEGRMVRRYSVHPTYGEPDSARQDGGEMPNTMSLPSTATTEDTGVMSGKLAQKILRENRLADEALIVLATNTSFSWRPGKNRLTIGWAGDIQVQGTAGGDILAQVTWEKDHHSVSATSSAVRLEVNQNAVSQAKLSPGDSFSVDSVQFRYEAPLGDR